MPAICECLGDMRSAQACLAGSTGIYFDQFAPSIFRFVREFLKERIPSSVIYGLGKHATRQTFDIQIFNGNQTIAVDQPSTGIVVKVRTLVLDLLMRLRHKLTGFSPALTRLLSPRHAALSSTQDRSRTVKMTLVIDLRSVGQGSQRSQSDIDTDCFSGFWQRFRLPLHRKTYVPLIYAALDRDRLDRAFNRTMQLDFDLSRTLDAQPVAQQSASISVQRKGQTVIAAERAKPWKSRLITTFASGKECFERLVQSSQHVLAAREIRKRETPIRSHRLQLVRLVVVINRLAAQFPRSNAFFKSSIIKRARFAQLTVQKLNLMFGGIQTVFERQAQLLLSIFRKGSVYGT